MDKKDKTTGRIKQEKASWCKLAGASFIVGNPPKPFGSPVDYAVSLSRWYCERCSSNYRKRMGQFFTPSKVARFMARLSTGNLHKILEPGAGTGILSCAVVERAIELDAPYPIKIVAYEPDLNLADLLEISFEHASKILTDKGGHLKYEIRRKNFIQDILERSLNLDHHLEDAFANYSLAIANPPYFKLDAEDILVKYAKDRLEGATNIYTLMMGLSAKLLSPDGEMIFIIPRSFASGAYFSKFRKQLLQDVHLNYIHVFESRKATFSVDNVLQENIIVRFDKKMPSEGIRISYSSGIDDLEQSMHRLVPLNRMYDVASKEHVINIPLDEVHDAIVDLVKSWKGSLHKYGLEISTGPVVSHRSLNWITESLQTGKKCVPLLWMQNVRPMIVEWPLSITKKQQYAIECRESERWLVPDNNYVLLRRFSAKEERRRLTAAPLLMGVLGSNKVGIENHLNFIHKPNGSIDPDEAYGLAALLNSKILDTYFRVFSGNTQVSATEIRNMPLPSYDSIKLIGERVRVHEADLTAEVVDEMVCKVVGVTMQVLKNIQEIPNGKNRRSAAVA